MKVLTPRLGVFEIESYCFASEFDTMGVVFFSLFYFCFCDLSNDHWQIAQNFLIVWIVLKWTFKTLLTSKKIAFFPINMTKCNPSLLLSWHQFYCFGQVLFSILRVLWKKIECFASQVKKMSFVLFIFCLTNLKSQNITHLCLRLVFNQAELSPPLSLN